MLCPSIQTVGYEHLFRHILESNEILNSIIQYYTFKMPFTPTLNIPNIIQKEKIKDVSSDTRNSPNETSISSNSEGNKNLFTVRKISDVSTSSDGKSVKSFYCTYRDCVKQYKSRENLFFHIQNVHLKQKPYACKYCENSFSHRNGLNYHLKNFHHCKIEKKKKKIKSNGK